MSQPEGSPQPWSDGTPPPAPPVAPPAPPAQGQPAPAPQAPPYPPYGAPQVPQVPQYGAPQTPQYGAPQGPPYGAPQYAAPVAPPRGLLPWVLGFLVVIPFPFIGGIASGVAMAVSGGGARRFGGPARENARAALNWGLTYLLVSTGLLVLHFVLLFVLTSQEQEPIRGFLPFGIPILAYLALSVAHLVIVIVGTVRVSSGKVMRVPVAIPFLRAG